MITFFHSGVRCEIKINMNGFTSRINFFVSLGYTPLGHRVKLALALGQ